MGCFLWKEDSEGRTKYSESRAKSSARLFSGGRNYPDLGTGDVCWRELQACGARVMAVVLLLSDGLLLSFPAFSSSPHSLNISFPGLCLLLFFLYL